MSMLTATRVLITGAGGGIGDALVRAVRAAGGTVIACDRSLDLLGGIEAEHKAGFDLTDAAACRQALRDIEAVAGLPDVVISNAGWTRAETLDQLDEEAWAGEIDINLTGARNLTAPLLQPMCDRGHGTFVFVSSVNAFAHFGNPAYASAKAGLNAYARAIATEYGRHGLRANAVCPGSVRTAGWNHRIARNPDIVARVSRLYPLGRLVEPMEVAHAAVFLASPLASGITGVALAVDAGLMAGNLPFIHEIA